MLFKITHLFNYTNNDGKAAGWSETWYLESSSSGNASNSAKVLAPLRAGMLGNGASIIGWRVQQIGKKAFVVQSTFPGGLATNQDIPQMALECKVYGVGVENVKYFQLRGIPDSIVLSGSYSPSSQFTTNLTAWGNGLNANGFSFNCLDQTLLPVKINNILTNGSFGLSAPLTFNPNDIMLVSRCRNTIGQACNGPFRVLTKVDALSGVLAGWKFGPVDNSGNMRVRKYVNPIVQINSLQPIQISTRKVGRPFFQYRGRARRR